MKSDVPLAGIVPFRTMLPSTTCGFIKECPLLTANYYRSINPFIYQFRDDMLNFVCRPEPHFAAFVASGVI